MTLSFVTGMTKLSFPLVVTTSVPIVYSLIRVGACAVVVCALAACGGGGSDEPAEQAVRGSQFSFQGPSDWKVTRSFRQVVLRPSRDDVELVSVSVFRTVKPYRPSLFVKAVPEIDRAARAYAQRLGGSITSSATVTVAGRPVRQYVVDYDSLRERISFVFRDRREYFLVCQWKNTDDEPASCSLLTESFRLI
jgi:hypothetical protein